jgi:tetratricopeptide (TPR) repeat protein
VEPQLRRVIKIFCSYSHRDEELRQELQKHLKILERRELAMLWHDRKIGAGSEWKSEIDKQLEAADIILLLISPDFIASDYCYDKEMVRAMERHEAGEARVIPIFLRDVNWEGAPFSKLQALPTDAHPVTSNSWPNQDVAFKIVSQGVQKIVEELLSKRQEDSTGDGKSPASSLIPRPPIIGFVARRDAEGRDIVERLQEELAPGKNQLVTLSGPGGVGKTTLAAEAARTLEKTYQGRFVWSDVNARASYTLSTLLDDIATQLGQPALRKLNTEDKEVKVSVLITDPPALFVLDNYETISSAEQRNIEAWFEHTNCSALITSRQRINKTLNIVISAMSSEEAQEFLKRLVEKTSDKPIFTDNVRQRIYETAEANPFVMEWIVAQIDQAQEPDAVLEELKHGEGDAAFRVFDRSFNLPQLGDDGRDTLLALSLFVPSATRDALAKVADFGENQKRINEAVKSLRGLWLIKGIDQNRRFTIEGLTRTLAKAHLSKDKRAAKFKERFIAYFLGYAEAHSEMKSEDFDALEVEKDNVLNALDAAYEIGDWASVMSIRAPLENFLDLRGYWAEAILRGEQALQAARNAQLDNYISYFAHNVAVIYQYRGDLSKAQPLYYESLEINKKLGNQGGVALTLHELGRISQTQGDLTNAQKLYNESLEISKELGNLSAVAITLHHLAMIAQKQGDLEEARRLYNESLTIEKKVGDKRSLSMTLHQLGRLAQLQQDLVEAKRFYNESLEISKELGNLSGIALALHQLGRLAENSGDLAEAARLWREALSIFKQLGSPDAEIARQNLERIMDES